MDEFVIKDEKQRMNRTDLTHAVSTMVVVIEKYNDMMDAGHQMVQAVYPGLTDDERDEMRSILGAISIKLTEVGEMLTEGRRRFYAEQGIAISPRELEFSSERD